MRTRTGILPGPIVATVTRYVGREVKLTDDFSDDVGLDSIDRLNLMTAIELAHDIELSDEEIASVNTLRDLLCLLKVETRNSGAEAGAKKRGSINPQAGGNHENP